MAVKSRLPNGGFNFEFEHVANSPQEHAALSAGLAVTRAFAKISGGKALIYVTLEPEKKASGTKGEVKPRAADSKESVGRTQSGTVAS